MRTAKTHHILHGDTVEKLAHGTDVPLAEQKRRFKELRSNVVNDKIAEVHYQESDGPLLVVRFITSKQKAAQEESQRKAEAESKKHSEAEAKKQQQAREAKTKKLKAIEQSNIDADKKARAEAEAEAKRKAAEANKP